MGFFAWLFGKKKPVTLAEYAKARGMSIRALCKECGMSASTVRTRVKWGWTVEEALNINPWDKRK